MENTETLKVCCVCKLAKPLSSFYRNAVRADGHTADCRSCRAKWYQEKEADRRKERRQEYVTQGKPIRGTFAVNGRKRCGRCGEDKEATNAFFGQNRKESDRLDRTCRLCRRQKWLEAKGKYGEYHRKARSKDNPVARWRSKIRMEMIEAYGSKCACCGEKEPDFLTLDHIGGRNNQNHPWSPNRGGSSIYGKLKKMGWPKDLYRLLCYNCNCATSWGRTCPHELARLTEQMTEWIADDLEDWWNGKPSLAAKHFGSRNG